MKIYIHHLFVHEMDRVTWYERTLPAATVKPRVSITCHSASHAIASDVTWSLHKTCSIESSGDLKCGLNDDVRLSVRVCVITHHPSRVMYCRISAMPEPIVTKLGMILVWVNQSVICGQQWPESNVKVITGRKITFLTITLESITLDSTN